MKNRWRYIYIYDVNGWNSIYEKKNRRPLSTRVLRHARWRAAKHIAFHWHIMRSNNAAPVPFPSPTKHTAYTMRGESDGTGALLQQY